MVAPTDKELIKIKKDVYLSKDNVVTLNTGPAPTFGVFFDGTNNNYLNDKITSGNDNSPSNITKLWELYKEEKGIDKHYEHGVGTTTGSANKDLDSAFAFSFGKHLQNGVDALKKFLDDYPHAQKVIIDVFGFSRGAACARAFVNEVLRSTQVDPLFWGGPKPEFRFVGVFDTVGSVGMAGDSDNDNWMIHVGNSLTGPAILDINEKAVKKLVHLTAGDEIRSYFPLSSVKSNGGIPGNFIEEQWPGAHSDIGGGYGHRPQTINFESVPFQDDFNHLSDNRKKEILLQAKSFTEQYYPDNGRIRGRIFKYKIAKGARISRKGHNGHHKTQVFPSWQRKSINEICNMTLERMHQFALESEVPFRPIDYLKKIEGEIEYQLAVGDYDQYELDEKGKPIEQMVTTTVSGIDEFGNDTEKEVPKRLPTPYKVTAILRKLVTAVMSNGNECPEYDVLYRNYIHISHQYTSGLIAPNAAESNPDVTAPNGQREMFYNNQTAAIDPDKYEDTKSFEGIHQEDNEYG